MPDFPRYLHSDEHGEGWAWIESTKTFMLVFEVCRVPKLLGLFSLHGRHGHPPRVVGTANLMLQGFSSRPRRHECDDLVTRLVEGRLNHPYRVIKGGIIVPITWEEFLTNARTHLRSTH